MEEVDMIFINSKSIFGTVSISKTLPKGTLTGTTARGEAKNAEDISAEEKGVELGATASHISHR